MAVFCYTRAMNNLLKSWLPLALTITVMSGLIYVSVQQSLRLSANDPQIQLAEDFAFSISNNQQLSIPPTKIEITRSLATFVIVTDAEGKSIFSSVLVNGRPALPPQGVLDYSKTHEGNQITWQPQPGARAAIVVRNAFNPITKKSGYIIVGRSLHEVEKRIDILTKIILAAWLSSLALTLALTWTLARKTTVPPGTTA